MLDVRSAVCGGRFRTSQQLVACRLADNRCYSPHLFSSLSPRIKPTRRISLPPFPSSKEAFLMTAAIAPSAFVIPASPPAEGPILLNFLIVYYDRLIPEASRQAAIAFR